MTAAFVDVGFAVGGALVSLLLLWYLHDEWQAGWAVGCGALAAFLRRFLARGHYASFPAVIRRPLDVAVLLLGTLVSSWGTLAAGDYTLPYIWSIWREAVALPALAVFLGLAIAAVIFTHSRLEREIAERQRLEQDLLLANEIQQSLLAATFPKLRWVETWAVNVPSRSVGGDYYEVFDEGAEDRLSFAIGDVSGKGVPAALLMSTLQSAFLGVASAEPDLAKVCLRVNRFLVERTSTDRYATFFAGRLEVGGGPRGGTLLRFVNAGHNPPFVLGANGYRRLSGGGMPLGLFPQASYQLHEDELAAGDLILCYTDGITEALSPEEEEFGEERLLNAAIEHRELGASALIETIRKAVENHTRGAPQYDDLTLLVLKLGAAESEAPREPKAGDEDVPAAATRGADEPGAATGPATTVGNV